MLQNIRVQLQSIISFTSSRSLFTPRFSLDFCLGSNYSLILFKVSVMQISDSRASSPLKSNLKSTRGSFFTKGTGRDVRANWSNRIVKDFNDLEYDVSVDRFANKNKFKNADILKRRKVQADIKSRQTSKRKIKAQEGSSFRSCRRQSASKGGRGITLGVPLPNPEHLYLSSINTSDNKFYGLCPHEYVNTIEGRMAHRQNHHLSFQKNRVNRSVNQHPIYYNRHQDVDFSFVEYMDQRKRMKKYHPFGSYTDRRVFEPKDELDKFYDEDGARRIASPHRMREAVRKFENVIGRAEPKYNESVTLSYDTVPCKEKVETSAEKYSIPLSVRETAFSRQVISPSRGCYR